MARTSFPKLLIQLVLFSSLLSAGCQPQQPDISASDNLTSAVAQTYADMEITVEGRLVPTEYANISFTVPGQVIEVLVEEGDSVQVGTVLARLGSREQAAAAVAAADLEILAARQAQQTLTDLQQANLNRALIALNAARQGVWDAEHWLGDLSKSSLQAQVDLASAQILLAEDALEKAQDNFDIYKDEDEENIYRARYQKELALAQIAYDNALLQFEQVSGQELSFNIQQAETALDVAQEQLKLAQQDYDSLVLGPDPEAVEQARVRLLAAEAQLEAALAGQAQLELRATIDGTVVYSDLHPGQTVQPGQTLVMLADFSSWWVETEDLTEIDVIETSVGQPVIVIPDALPDLELNGTVASISNIFKEIRGDITYTARIQLVDTAPGLRWGMTVMVTFLKP